MELSICIVTMNRANQLKKAIQSCLGCDLPDKTEFVVIDNASTDETETVIKQISDECKYPVYYEKMETNIGAGNGRNYAFDKACGKYVYSMDDDAYIDCDEYNDFFKKAIDMLDKNENIASLTTQIYDTALKYNRVKYYGAKLADNIYRLSSVCESSNFLRKSFFEKSPYFPNDYGYEALPLVLNVFDNGAENCFCDNLLMIHDPVVNKWDYSQKENHKLLIKGLALPYAIKRMMYPSAFRPALEIVHALRIYKYASSVSNARKEINKIAMETIEQYPIEYKIKAKTVIKLFRNFGMNVF